MNSSGELTGVSAELVRDPVDLVAIADRWRELAVARENAFITPEWFDCWLRHYGDRDRPLVPVARDGAGVVVGLLPLVTPASGRSQLVRFAGSSLGDHFEPVAPTALDATVGHAAGAVLRSARHGRPGLVLENVDADAGWWAALSHSSGCGDSPLVDRRTPLPRVLLGGRSYEEYLASRSRNMRSQLGRRRRALERDHGARFRWTADPAEVEEDVATLFRLHDMRWHARRGSSSITSPRVRAFLADFAGKALARGWLRLCVLEAGGSPVAAWYGWRLGGRFAYYQAGFDPRWSDRSVGLVLLAETVRAAAEEGAREYDMLLGEEAFKTRFADSAREVCTAVVAPRLRPSRLLAASEMRLRRLSRRLPEGVRDPAKRRARAALERLPMARRR